MSDSEQPAPDTPPAEDSAAPAPKPPTRGRWLLSLLVLVVALFARLAHLQEASQGPLMKGVIPMRDSRYYDMIARQVAEGDLVGDHVFYLAPLYPYVLAIPHAIFRTPLPDGGYEYDITAIRYVQSIGGAVTCWLLFWVGCLAFGRLVGTLSGLTAALYGLFIYYDSIFMPTGLILFLHTLALLVLLVAARRQGLAWWLIGGVTLGLCALAHGTALLLTLCVLLWILVAFPTVSLPRRLARAALVVAGFAPLIGVVTIRNYAVGEDFVLLTSNAGRNLFIGNNPTANGSFRFYPAEVTLYHYMRGLDRRPGVGKPSERSRRYVTSVKQFVSREPLREAGLLLRKLRLFFNAVEVGINDHFYFARRYSTVLRSPLLSFGIVVPLGLTGLVFALGRWREHLLFIVFIASQVAAFTIMFVLGRYRVVAVACLMVLAAAQITWWISWVRQRRFGRLAGSAVVLALATVLVHTPIDGFTTTRGLGQQFAQVGHTYLAWEQYDQAIEAYHKALESTFEPWATTHFQRAMCYSGLGDAYAAQDNPSQAIDMYKKALGEIDLEKVAAQDGLELQAKRLQERISQERRKLWLR